ncbi:MAG: plastocyanin/azurin family copper-binding protein [Balneolales bacterium]
MRSANYHYIHCLALYLIFFMINTGLSGAQNPNPSESDYYTINPLPVSDDIVLEAGGVTFNEDGQLAVTTRRGEVWLISNPESDNPSYDRFAQGLHEPLGIAYKDGAYIIAQRGELTKLTDSNNDGKADIFETIYRWPLTGNYHEYSYGPKFLPNGDMLVTLNLSWIGKGASLTDWRGWMLQITEDGEMTPFAAGLRSPMGFQVTADGDVFYAENQGDWIGSGWITHLERGDFAGNPEGLKWSHLPGSPIDLKMEDIDDTEGLSMYEQAKNIPELKLPTVWFPHTIMGISTADILEIESDQQVGPFAGQLLVADQGHSKIMRVSLEEVNGEYQGAVFGFREGFSSGVIKLEWGPNDEIYTGMTSRGWSSTGESYYGIDRMVWNGETPFEMHSIKAESNGFTVNFTKPVEEETAADINSYQITDFTYKYHRDYGSPVIKREGRAISNIEVADDKRSVRLYVQGLREGFINEVKAEGVQSDQGTGLLHPVGYYTLNSLPDGDRFVTASFENDDENAAETTATAKNVTSIPAEWAGDADETIRLNTEPGLKFDRDEISVKAGSKVAFTFNNDDDMLHNVVIVQPGTADPVGMQAMQLGLDGDELGYVPQMDEVLFHSSLLQPNDSETFYFIAPEEPGEYEFVCTFPGHHTVMRGTLIVTE